MANEISLSAALSFLKAGTTGSPVGRAVTDTLQSVSGAFYIEGVFQADIVPQPIPMGQVSQPRWAWFKNLDAAVTIQVSNGFDLPFLAIPPGVGFPVPLDGGCVPYAVVIGDTTALLEYLIISL